ncbi:MAG: 16S rRNA (cytosine(1402)-N(4))-methyltransferase RsmH [Candidatus Krumholzibacteriota bacterium]|nr:16S rRNA (cytosine(1402)-N(4))-methyltransferase RsmH [Candidatus Krumholzibacteriota bacterium]
MHHIPVMSGPVIRFLITDPKGRYVDCTLGLGGHSLTIMETSGDELHLTGIDRDQAALAEARKRLKRFRKRITYIQGNFVDIDSHLKDLKYTGFLLDLGLSSFQISDSKRGFSYLDDGPLDMCMGSNGHSVRKLIAAGTEGQIRQILWDYGEEKNGRAIAREIVKTREEKEISRTSQLRSIVERVVPGHRLISSLSRVFQAFRIWANDELENLAGFLPKAVDMLEPGGRIVVMSYHSLEDRIVKDFFKREEKGCICPSDFPVCNCGKSPSLKVLTRRPVCPSPEEIVENPRARSAKLRAAERL